MQAEDQLLAGYITEAFQHRRICRTGYNQYIGFPAGDAAAGLDLNGRFRISGADCGNQAFCTACIGIAEQLPVTRQGQCCGQLPAPCFTNAHLCYNTFHTAPAFYTTKVQPYAPRLH